jgi:hypothetical protein
MPTVPGAIGAFRGRGEVGQGRARWPGQNRLFSLA